MRISRWGAGLVWAFVVVTLPQAAFALDQKPPREPTEREKAVSALLVAKLGEDAATIKVVIQRDKAALSGQVENRVTMELATEVALSFEGIRGTSNRIRARKAPTLPDGQLLREGLDAELERRVSKAIRRVDPEAGKALEVEAADGVVSVRGQLSAARRARALATAQGVPGVTFVLDLVRVGN